MAERWFLKIDGVEGESTDAVHKGEIDVQAWSWGLAQAGGAPTGSGGGAGKVTFQDMQFVARISKASPTLFISCATGAHHKSAELTGVRTAGKDAFLKYRLTDVRVTSVQDAGSEPGPPTEQFSLGYDTLDITYRPQNPKGQLEPPITAGFDVRHHKKL